MVGKRVDLEIVWSCNCIGVGFERDEGKVLIHRGIEGQGINTPFPFTLYYQGGGVLPLSRGQKMFSTRAKV